MVWMILIVMLGGGAVPSGLPLLAELQRGCCMVCACGDKPEPSHCGMLAQFLADKRQASRTAVAAASRWLDQTHVDPIELRGHGIKGKKKLAELLNSYEALWRRADAEGEKERLLGRMKEVVAVTYTTAYHDMGTIPDLQFKQDATSYLRVAYLMDAVGLDTSMYRREIDRVKGRLDGHMGIRGANQQMAFHVYYRHFGLEEPFALSTGFQRSEIANRSDPYGLDKNGVYRFTHEIFVPYDFGASPDARFFSDQEMAYIERALEILLPAYVYRGDADLTAELVSCAWYVRHFDTPRVKEALEFLLRSQNEDGSWGTYRSLEKRYGEYVREGWYLHTTMVVMEALLTAFGLPPSC